MPSGFHHEQHPAKPFNIGLAPLKAENFLQVDDELPRFRAEKRKLYDREFSNVCKAEAHTTDSQWEARDLLIQNLNTFHGSTFKFAEGRIHCLDDNTIVEDNLEMPLSSAALLIADDLVLMRRDENGWRLVAASLAFPSSWRLADKFGQPMRAIHGPVPMGHAMATRIDRIFDGLQPTIPVFRGNWSLDETHDLRLDFGHGDEPGPQQTPHWNTVLRTEFQTLHKLPKSGDILFTIGIRTRTLRDFANTEEGQQKMTSLAKQLAAMTPDERSYKRISDDPGILKPDG